MDDDVATAFKELRAEVTTASLETRVSLANMDSHLASFRADLAEHRLQSTQGFARVDDKLGGMDRKLDLLIDSLAEFRAEYNQHTHGGTE